MSEHLYNGLEIIGRDDQVKEVLEFLKGKSENDGSQMEVDFKTIIPMPEELFDKLYFEPNDAFKYVEGKLPVDYDYKLEGKRCSWSSENWGCKGNAYGAGKGINNNCIGLFLVGGDAFPVISRLSKIFPKLVFVYEIIGESSNLHLYTLSGGNIVKYFDIEYVSSEMTNGLVSEYNSILYRELYERINPEIKQVGKQKEN